MTDQLTQFGIGFHRFVLGWSFLLPFVGSLTSIRGGRGWSSEHVAETRNRKCSLHVSIWIRFVGKPRVQLLSVFIIPITRVPIGSWIVQIGGKRALLGIERSITRSAVGNL